MFSLLHILWDDQVFWLKLDFRVYNLPNIHKKNLTHTTQASLLVRSNYIERLNGTSNDLIMFITKDLIKLHLHLKIPNLVTQIQIYNKTMLSYKYGTSLQKKNTLSYKYHFKVWYNLKFLWSRSNITLLFSSLLW